MERRIVGALIGLVVLVAVAFGLRHMLAENERLKDELKVSQQTAKNNAEAVRQVERHHDTVTIVREKEREAIDAVRAAPGAETPIDPDRRAILCERLSRMRNGAAVCTD